MSLISSSRKKTNAAVLAAAVAISTASVAMAGVQINLTFADDSQTKTLTSASGVVPGTTTYDINVWAYVTGTNGVSTDEGFASGYYGVQSSSPNASLFSGNLTGTAVGPGFAVGNNATQLGTLQNMTISGTISSRTYFGDDGKIDLGGSKTSPTYTNSQINAEWQYVNNGTGNYVTSANAAAGGFTVQNITGGIRILIGTVTLTVDAASFATPGTNDAFVLNPVLPPSTATLLGTWKADGANKTSSATTYTAGTGVTFKVTGDAVSGNNTQILIDTPTTSDTGTGASAKTVALGGNYLLGANITTGTLQINKTGSDSTTYSATIGNDTVSTTFAGGATSNNTGTITLNSSTYGAKSGTVTIDNLAADSAAAGQGSADANDVFTVTATVGMAASSHAGSMFAFAPALSASGIANNASIAGLASKTTAGSGTIGTEAIIKAGKNTTGSAATISMAWRDRVAQESEGTATAPPMLGISNLHSDVVELTGLTLTGGQTSAYAAEASPFVLQMSYADYSNETIDANAGLLRLATLDKHYYGAGETPAEQQWVFATDNNFGTQYVQGSHLISWGDFATANGVTDNNLGSFMGAWGVDTTNNVVWAVLNHNSDFAVVPEPASLGLLAIGAMGLLARRRK